MPTAELLLSEELESTDLIGSLDEEMAQLLESIGESPLMANTGTCTCTHTCTCTATQFSSRPCCC